MTWYMESEDEGHTFSEPQELVPGDIGGRGPVKNKPIRLSDGTVLAPGSLEGKLWDGFVDISRDDCRTWERSDLVPLHRLEITNEGVHNVQVIDRPYDRHYIYGKVLFSPPSGRIGMEKYICSVAAAAPGSSAAIPRMAEGHGVWHMTPGFPTITAVSIWSN